jgi:hypothetical protein
LAGFGAFVMLPATSWATWSGKSSISSISLAFVWSRVWLSSVLPEVFVT